VALVATDGTIGWCCLPRFDSPAVFASLLDADRGGCFAVRSEAVRTRQLDKPGTNVLVTRFLGTGSVGEVVDFTVPRHPGIPLMRPGPVLVRGQRAARGSVVFTITCRPAFDFGRQDHAVHAPDSVARCSSAREPRPNGFCAAASGSPWPGPPPRQRSPWALRRAWTCCWSGAARTSRDPRRGPAGIQALQNATRPRELHWIDGASHNDLYYKEQYLGPAITKLADFFTSNLAAADTTPAQAASA